MTGWARWVARGAAVVGGVTLGAVAGAVALRVVNTARFGPARADAYLIVGLGDSVPAGTAAGGPDFLRRLGESAHVTTGLPFQVLNLAVPGLTTSGLGRQLYLPGVRRPVAAADVVVITIGANDFTWPLVKGRAEHRVEPTFARLRHRLEHVIEHVVRLRGGRTRGVLMTGYWNISKDGARADRLGPVHRDMSDALTRRLNDLIRELAEAHGLVYVDLYEPFKGDGGLDPTALLARDGAHPNAAGHATIAAAVRDAARAARAARRDRHTH